MVRYEVNIDGIYFAGWLLEFWWPRERPSGLKMVLLSSAIPWSPAPAARWGHSADTASGQQEGRHELPTSNRETGIPAVVWTRVANGVLVIAAEEEGVYYRVGMFVSYSVKEGGLCYFRKIPTERVALI